MKYELIRATVTIIGTNPLRLIETPLEFGASFIEDTVPALSLLLSPGNTKSYPLSPYPSELLLPAVVMVDGNVGGELV